MNCCVEPRLVDAQVRIGEETVAIEALDVVALERAAVAPDVDVVFLHRDHQHGAGDRAAERRRVEVRVAGRRDVERAGLQRGDAFGNKLRAAVDKPRLFGAVLQRAARDVVVVRLVRLAEVRGVRVRNGAPCAHPVQRGAGVEPAGEGDADFLAGGKVLEDVRHVRTVRRSRAADDPGYSSRTVLAPRRVARDTPIVRPPPDRRAADTMQESHCTMPELPDVTVYRSRSPRAIVGARSLRVRIVNPFVLRTAIPPIESAHGRRIVADVRADRQAHRARSRRRALSS